MTRPAVTLFLLCAACGQPPRSIGYFEAHPEATARVLAACTRGTQRGLEGENAQGAAADLKANAREALFRRGFP